MKKICIAGPGAIGGLFAARLAANGAAVSCLARGETLNNLQQQGQALTANGRTDFYPVTASHTAADLGEQDLLIIALKQPALNALAPTLAPLINAHTRILVAMNGVPWWFFNGIQGEHAGSTLDCIDPAGALSAIFPVEQIIGCVMHLASFCPAPGHAELTMGNRVILGEPNGGCSATTQAAFELLQQAGFDCELSEHIQSEIWFKLWGNMTHNPISAITGATCDVMLDDPHLNELIVNIMTEAKSLGEKLGCTMSLTPKERNASTRQLGALRTSMLQDTQAGKTLEIEALLGTVVEIAEKLDHPAPATRGLYGLIKVFAQTHKLI